MLTVMHSRDWSNEALDELRAGALTLGIRPVHVLQVIYSESGAKARAHNPNGGASGLLQFMPKTLLGLGWTNGPEAFRKLEAEAQIPFVLSYLDDWAHEGLDTAARVYVATFLPALLPKAKSLDYVLCARHGQLSWAFEANSVLDVNRDYAITVGELALAIERNCVGARFNELAARLAGTATVAVSTELDCYDIRTPRGIQAALERLGYEPGPIDGVVGPKTRFAIRAFQADNALTTDGIAGPLTRAVLEKELQNMPPPAALS